MRAILAGPMMGEFGWETLRFAPHVLWQKISKYKNKVKLIVYTRPDRFDFYGINADIFEPLEIKGDYSQYQSDCFKLQGFPEQEYHLLAQRMKAKYETQFNIVEHIYPRIHSRQYTEKEQYLARERKYQFQPRLENLELFDAAVPHNKPLVVLAPRYRKQGKMRNWQHWDRFYDIISTDAFLKKFNFIICGRRPEYVPDKHGRFFDINDIELKENTSLVGITITALRRAVLTVGSQSGLPNLSNLVKTPTLQWGHEMDAHARKYNVKKTPTKFLLDKKFSINPEVIVQEMKKLLKGKEVIK